MLFCEMFSSIIISVLHYACDLFQSSAHDLYSYKEKVK